MEQEPGKTTVESVLNDYSIVIDNLDGVVLKRKNGNLPRYNDRYKLQISITLYDGPTFDLLSTRTIRTKGGINGIIDDAEPTNGNNLKELTRYN